MAFLFDSLYFHQKFTVYVSDINGHILICQYARFNNKPVELLRFFVNFCTESMILLMSEVLSPNFHRLI